MIKIKQVVPSGLLLLITGIVLITLGLYRGELDIVFSKAISICLECIGIG